VLNPALVPTLVDTLKVEALASGRLSAPGGMAQVSFPMTDQARREGSLPASGRLPFVASRPDSHALQMERS
jgi:hypothetical protein